MAPLQTLERLRSQAATLNAGIRLGVKTMRISQLAAEVGLDVETVRYYEKAGLVPAPARLDNNYRRYDDAALERLRFIRNCRALDMSLEEVRVLLAYIDRPRADCSPVDELVAGHLVHVRQRIASLRTLERQLEALHSACAHSGPAKGCGIVRELKAAPRGKRRAATPLHGVHRA
jgi:Cd(II)/Pb(II)-responsive transcriptional regulator